VFLAIVAAVQLGTGIVVSDICEDPDDKIIQLITNYTEVLLPNDTTVPDLLVYYIHEEGNPAVFGYLTMATKIVRSVINGEPLFEIPLAALESHCSAVMDMHLVQTVRTLQKTLAKATFLLNQTYIYPFYKEIVHDVVCGSMLKAAGWTVSQQVVVLLVLLPTLALASDHYLETLQTNQNLKAETSKGYWLCCGDSKSDTEENADGNGELHDSAVDGWTSPEAAEHIDRREIKLLDEPSHNNLADHYDQGIHDHQRTEPSAISESSALPACVPDAPSDRNYSAQQAASQLSSPAYSKSARHANGFTPRVGLTSPSPIWHGLSPQSPRVIGEDIPLFSAQASDLHMLPPVQHSPGLPEQDYSAMPRLLNGNADMRAANVPLQAGGGFGVSAVSSRGMPAAPVLSHGRTGCWCTTPDRQNGLTAASQLSSPIPRYVSGISGYSVTSTQSSMGSCGSGQPLLMAGRLASPGRQLETSLHH